MAKRNACSIIDTLQERISDLERQPDSTMPPIDFEHHRIALSYAKSVLNAAERKDLGSVVYFCERIIAVLADAPATSEMR